MTLGIIGLGLIGGSFALDLRANNLCDKIIGVERNPLHSKQAIDLGIIDSSDDLEAMVQKSDLIVIAISVNQIPEVLLSVLDNITSDKVVIDLGSTKESICSAVTSHDNRANYVACHPIAGTENTGPNAAFSGLYKGKVNIICNNEMSSPEALEKALLIFEAIGMKNIFMEASEHDKHIAYVSHLSHISSFALGKTVLEIEESENNIFNMAGSGFASTVRLAKSSPNMWAPIFDQNAKNISMALGAYINNLKEFKSYIDNHEADKTHQVMADVNEIKRVLNGIELNN
jgi:prephenate dehydrogenase